MTALILPGPGGLIVAGRPGFTTFNPADKSANLTLSNGNLTVAENTNTVNGDEARSIAHHSTGKYYAESTIDVFANAFGAGVAVCDASLIITNGTASTAHGASYDSDGWIRGNNGNLVNTGVTFTTGDRIGSEVDCDARTFRVCKNGGSWSSLADISYITGELYYACYCYGTVNNQITTNFGATAYVDTPPVGASNW